MRFAVSGACGSVIPEGKHQFRLSVLWKRGLPMALESCRNFPDSLGGHVLLPGGDDDPKFTNFQFATPVRTHRQNSLPGIQVSFSERNSQIGEIDIDFDRWRCHFKPSNSDPGSTDIKRKHAHRADFNSVYNFFTQPLVIVEDHQNHCREWYSDGP